MLKNREVKLLYRVHRRQRVQMRSRWTYARDWSSSLGSCISISITSHRTKRQVLSISHSTILDFSDFSMPLCHHCGHLTLEVLLPSPQLHDPSAIAESAYLHWNSYAALELSAKVCELCRLIMYTLETGDEYGGTRDRADDFESFCGDGRDDRSQIYLRAGDLYHIDTNVPQRIALLSIDCGGAFTGILRIYTDDGKTICPLTLHALT